MPDRTVDATVRLRIRLSEDSGADVIYLTEQPDDPQ
jgi:hypothetical protein